MNRHNQTCAPWLLVALSLTIAVLCVQVACNGPSYPALINDPITVATHNRDFFPVAHGQSENPSGDCNACHGGMSSFEEFTCLTCHAHEKDTTDKEHRGLNGYKYDSGSCLGCHPSGDGTLGREDHTELYFPIEDGSNHDEQSCSDCHTTGDYEKFECIDCHEHAKAPMAEAHDGLSGYEWESQSCFTCHPGGESELGRDDHTRIYFPIDETSKHDDQACSECHTTGSYDKFECIECHEHAQSPMQEVHQGISAYEWESQSCFSCHPSGESDLGRDDHTNVYFPINDGTKHEDAGCSECHTTESYDKFECIECHEHAQSPMAEEHNGVSGYTWESQSCFQCHPDGESVELGRDDHTQIYFPINNGTKHEDAGCVECHTTGNYDKFECIECHEHAQSPMASEHNGVSGYTWESQSCFQCHPDGESVELDRDDHSQVYFPINNGTKHEDAGCVECHTTGSYDKFECIECHEHAQSPMATEHSSVAGYTWESQSCFQCHPSGIAVSRSEHDDFPIDTGDKHAQEGCDDCHKTADYNDFTCVDCHTHTSSKMNSAHDDVSSYNYKSANCYSCHPDSIVLTKSEHTPWFPITSGDHSRYSCDDCHKTAGTYQDFTCIGCHVGEHTCREMDDEHDDVRNYTCEDNACLSCHPDGRD